LPAIITNRDRKLQNAVIQKKDRAIAFSEGGFQRVACISKTADGCQL